MLGVVMLLCSWVAFRSYELEYPSYFPPPVYDFDKTPLSASSVRLGRVLFYDPILSKDSTISCASCHSPYNAFAHTDHDLSHGIRDQIGTRNAPALFNLAWQTSFMWDGRIPHLDMQALAPISAPSEMDESLANIVLKLQRSNGYKSLFREAYADTSITGTRILKALSQFQLTLVSANAKYDRVLQKKDTFTHQEQSGYALFKRHCNHCHTEPLFTNGRFASNGLPQDSTLMDEGLGSISLQKNDRFLFKIPSLRNLSFSPPYMHDGRFKKLSQVLHHYTQGAKNGENLDVLLQSGMALSSNEKVDIIAFLLTLDDKSFVFDKKHQFLIQNTKDSEGKK